MIAVATGLVFACVTACVRLGGSRSQPAASSHGIAVTATTPSTSVGEGAPRVPLRVVTMRGFDGPGPARYDRVRVVRIGSSSAPGPERQE